MPKARVNGVEINYEVTGQGTPVLFIHGGFGGPATTLAPQVRAITTILPADRVQTITYDRRCAGQSEYVLDWYTVEDLADDARALLAHLGIERSIVIGDSMGGMVAIQYALKYPQHVMALGLLETGADLMSETNFGKQGQELVERVRREGDRAVFESRKEQLRNPPEGTLVRPRTEEAAARMRAQREALLAALARVSDEELCRYFAGTVRNYAAFIGYDFTPRLGELKMPVCIVHGNADTTVPFSYGKALHAAIPHSEFHEIPEATHGILMFPEAAEVVRAWVLRTIEAGVAPGVVP